MANNAVPGWISTGSVTPGARADDGQRDDRRVRAQQLRLVPADDGKYYEDYRGLVPVGASASTRRGSSRSAPTAIRRASATTRRTNIPYMPIMSYRRRQPRRLWPATTRRVGPAAHAAGGEPQLRWSFQDDLSWTRGRHNFKFGVIDGVGVEDRAARARTTWGNYNFGHNAANPLSTGNGYANALIGVFTTYTELTNRVDRDRRHWQTEGYLQDSWRMKPRLHARLRRAAHAHRRLLRRAQVDRRLLRAELGSASQAPRLYAPTCTTGVPGNQTCAANNQRAYDPANPSVLLPSAFIGNLVPGTGSQINGMMADGYPGMRPGEYFELHRRSWRRRASGFAWDINGNGKQALRASTGIFYAIPTRGRVGEVTSASAPAAFTRVRSSGRRSTTSRTSRPRARRSSRRRSTPRSPAARRDRSRSPTT